MTLFEEALDRYVEAVQAVSRDEAGGETLHKKIDHMNAKRKALIDYVAEISRRERAARTQLEERIRRKP